MLKQNWHHFEVYIIIVPSYAVDFIYILGKAWFCFFYNCAVLCRDDFTFAPNQWETALLCNDVSHWQGASLESTLLMMCTHYLFAHYTNKTLLSSLCRCIWRYWIVKILLRYILSSMCLRLSQFSQSSFMQYMGLCVFGWPISLMMIVRTSVLDLNIIIKLEVWHIWYCLGSRFRVRSWNNGMHCMSFYTFIERKIGLSYDKLKELKQSGTKPNLAAKIWPPNLITICAWLPKLVVSVSTKLHHLVNTGLTVGSLARWLPLMVAHICKLDTIWVVYISPIGNGSIRL